MAPLSKLILALALTGACAKQFSADVTTSADGEPISLTWDDEESDKFATAKEFAQKHASEIEGLSCEKGNTECYTAVLLTHMLKTEEEGQLPSLYLGAAYSHTEQVETEEEVEEVEEAEPVLSEEEIASIDASIDEAEAAPAAEENKEVPAPVAEEK